MLSIFKSFTVWYTKKIYSLFFIQFIATSTQFFNMVAAICLFPILQGLFEFVVKCLKMFFLFHLQVPRLRFFKQALDYRIILCHQCHRQQSQ